jgi:hypothetical protein
LLKAIALFQWWSASPKWLKQLAMRQLSEVLQSLLTIADGQERAVNNAIAIVSMYGLGLSASRTVIHHPIADLRRVRDEQVEP